MKRALVFLVTAYSIILASFPHGQSTGSARPGPPTLDSPQQTSSSSPARGFALSKAGVITVRVTDEFGESVAGVDVQAQQPQWGPDGRRQVVAGAHPRQYVTNDLGEARLYGLSPGEFVLLATKTSMPVTSGGGTAADTSETFAPTYYPGKLSVADAEPVVVGVGGSCRFSFRSSRQVFSGSAAV